MCFVWFPSGSAEIIGCDIMRSKKFDVIAVDELDTMHLEADLTDANVSADAASVITMSYFALDYFNSSLGERGAGSLGPAPPPGKEPG